VPAGSNDFEKGLRVRSRAAVRVGFFDALQHPSWRRKDRGMLFEGRKKAFEGAVDAYYDDLYRYAYWLCRNHWQAEDVVQEALSRAWRNWSGLREARALKSWLFTIVHNEFMRAAKRSRFVSSEFDADSLESDAPADPSAAIELRRALRILSEESRQALLLQVLGGFNCAEIAAMLGMREGAVMTRLSRARQALRRKLEPDDYAMEANIS